MAALQRTVAAAARLVRLEPALTAGLLQASIALIAALAPSLGPGPAGVVEAVATAVTALVVGSAARPFPVPLFTGGTAAIGTLLAAFGVPHASAGTVSLVNALLVTVLAVVQRGHLTPLEAKRGPQGVNSG